jgi:hypothetical protein
MFTIKFNDTRDHAEHDWLVLKNGRFVAGFAGSNAAERWIAVEKEIEKAARRSPPMSRAERRLIHALLNGRH